MRILSAVVCAVFVLGACSSGSDDEPVLIEASAESPETPIVQRGYAPGGFGERYWRLFESGLHRSLGFDPTYVDDGTLFSGARWFRLKGELEGALRGATVEIYAKLRKGREPRYTPHEPYVLVYLDEPRYLEIHARDDNGTTLRIKVTGYPTKQEKVQVQEDVASVIQA